MHATFTQKVIICAVAGFLAAALIQWGKVFVEGADDKQLASYASEIAHIGTHNAYHIGQIVFVRKEQGSWDPEKGVK